MKETIYDHAFDIGVDIEVRCLEAFPSDDFKDIYQIRATAPSSQHVREVRGDTDEVDIVSHLEALDGYVGDSDD
jgi:hypothetical protein